MRASGQAVAAAALALLVLVAWLHWDAPRGRTPERESAGAVATDIVSCTADGEQAEQGAFRLGGRVVRATRWCDVSHVVIEVSGDVDDHEHMVVVVASSIASTTLTLPLAQAPTVAIGPDGWLAVAIVQASEPALARGGAWFQLTAGAPRP